MSRKGLILFSLAGLFWGIPYFLIAIALESFSTPTIVFARTAIGAIILIPYAIKTGSLKPALKAWPFVLLFAALEMIGPWFLITEAQKHISSGLAGLLIATVPFYAVAILALFFKDRSALRPVPLAGMAIGFLGVGIIIGIDSIVGDTSAIWIGAVVLAALGYASAAIMANRKLGEVPIAGTIGLSMLIVSLVYSIPASSFIPKEIASNPPLESWLAILALGVVCSALAFVIFFRLLREVGAVKATLITYVNTAVAILLGTVFLSEPITPGLIAGIPLIAIGLYLSTKSPGIKKRPRRFASYEDSSS
ncbi:DMT family transporter [Candidatus Aquiluna sp. UB-MaderosW2red]|uniref:DMT family transporter n=1 Tax=Candidatus Aquiluna sp. UB-MaderosW2red TaxID=1855377 RepID=UPI0015619EEB|nr:DMT family transporter [Candidatus Aquiluna sp. UB-MaderosW2red]